jgi:hypothetical protein
MSQYLLSTYAVEGEPAPEPPSPDAMQAMMVRIIALEAEMDATGTFVFGGRLHGPDAATVVRMGDSELITTDGPFVESKEHIAGFYIINADDLDAALDWAGRVSGCVGRPIEVQPLAGTGRVADQLPG